MSPIINRGCTGFVGADFSDFPGISVFGAFARVVRLNHISAKSYFSAFTLRNRRDDDLSRRLTFSGASRDAVAAALSLTSTATLDVAAWLPFQCDPRCLAANWSFRYCRACLRYGFHSLLHQLPWIGKCPWHRTRLLTTCAICDSRLTLAGGSKVLLLQCCNGHDPFNELISCVESFDQVEAATMFIESYLAWAKNERARSLLIMPESGTTRFDVIASAITLLPALRDCCQGPTQTSSTVHTRTLTLRSTTTNDVHDAPSALAKLSTLLLEGAGLELPRNLAPGFVKIGCSLAERLPPESLTDAEVSLFFDGLERQPNQTFKPAKRASLAEIRFLPPLLIGERRVVYRNTFSKTAATAAYWLLDAALNEPPHPDLEAEVGYRLLVHALGTILKRAYAEGMRVVLSRYVHALFDSKRDRPRLTEPWILIHKEGPQLQKVKIVWARRADLPW